MSLAYDKTSPVRGQLEPYHPDSRPGWRYLQCTDTPNELKVLLPPRTCALYARLLQLEAFELINGKNTNWNRIIEIRHLKDRMIRKCDRLARFTVLPPSAPPTPFRLVVAPPDFRLKEMERWLRTNDAAERSTREVLKRKDSSNSNGPAFAAPPVPSGRTSAARHVQPTPRTPSLHTPSSSKKRSSISSQSTHSQAPTIPEKPTQLRPPYLSPVVEVPTPIDEQRIPQEVFTTPLGMFDARPNPVLGLSHTPVATSHVPMSPKYTVADHRLPLVDPYLPQMELSLPQESSRMNAISPDPIPHPYRPPSGYIQPPGTLDEMYDAVRHAPAVGMPHAATEMPVPQPAPPPEPVPQLPQSVMVPEMIVQPPSQRTESIDENDANNASAGQPGLVRRRSSLKQNNRLSLNGSGKVVSWAMDRDWTEHMSKFDQIMYSTELAGEELRRAEEQFQGEIREVRTLRENIVVSLERLRLETERLQFEERTLREHEERMTASFERLRDKEVAYKNKVNAVMQETRRVVIASNNKKDTQSRN